MFYTQLLLSSECFLNPSTYRTLNFDRYRQYSGRYLEAVGKFRVKRRSAGSLKANDATESYEKSYPKALDANSAKSRHSDVALSLALSQLFSAKVTMNSDEENQQQYFRVL